jgi:hypothetical protein
VSGYAAFNHQQGDNAVQYGRGVIAAVNAGVLWSDPRALGHGQANHVVTITGVARDPDDGALQGFSLMRGLPRERAITPGRQVRMLW